MPGIYAFYIAGAIVLLALVLLALPTMLADAKKNKNKK